MKKKMGMFLFAMICLFGLSFMPLHTQAATKFKSYYCVTTSAVNMRARASTKSKKVLKLPKASAVKVTGKSGKYWYKVVYQNSKQKKIKGYIRSKYLKKATYYKVKQLLYLRPTASQKKKAVCVLPANAKVIVVQKTNKTWYKIVYYAANGKVYRGYSMCMYLEAVPATVTYLATSNVYMRDAASNNGKALVIVPQGEAVSVSSVSGNWYKCSYKTTEKTYTGYIYKGYLKKK